jgi:hypothetical protein
MCMYIGCCCSRRIIPLIDLVRKCSKNVLGEHSLSVKVVSSGINCESMKTARGALCPSTPMGQPKFYSILVPRLPVKLSLHFTLTLMFQRKDWYPSLSLNMAYRRSSNQCPNLARNFPDYTLRSCSSPYSSPPTPHSWPQTSY